MGAASPNISENKAFKIQDWQPIQWQPYTSIKDPTFSSNFTVYAHKNNHNLQIEKYQLFFNSQAQYVSYLQTYYERRKFPTLVNSIHIQQTTKKSMCSTFYSAAVYLERIHLRLFQLIQMPIQQGLFMIQSALQGYEKMFQKTGYFQISSDMIGINKEGKVKVWIHKNFSKNFPQFNKIDHNKTQHDFIFQLLKIIQDCIDYQKNRQTFSQFLKNKKIPPSFQNTKFFLKQYQKIYKYSSQKSMKSIVLWVKKNSNKHISAKTQSMTYFEKNFANNDSNQNGKSSFYYIKPNQSQILNGKKLEFSKLKTRKSNARVYEHNNGAKSNFIPYPITNQTVKDNIGVIQQKQFYENKQKQSQIFKRYGQNNLNYNQGTIHMSFIKNQRKQMQLDQYMMNENQNNKSSLKTIAKLPSVSFSYKSSGLYSPQNIQSKQMQWFGTIKVPEQIGSKERKKDLRKSLTMQISDIDQKMKFYYSGGDTYQIDPDIAKDLYSMANVIK